MSIDRVEVEFFEADEDGYMQGSGEAGEDGKAKGVEFVLYVQPPEVQIKHSLSEYVDEFVFTDDEIDSWSGWIQQQYPQADWNFDSDQGEASFYSDFRPGEDNNDIMMRLCVNNRHYNKIRNDCCLMYTMLFRYIGVCQQARLSERTSGVGWPE